MSQQFENGRELDGKSSSQGFDAKEVYLHPKNRSVSFQKKLKMFTCRHFQVFTRCSFQNVPVRVPFSKSTVFKICRQKMCRFRVNGRPIRRIFHRFQNVPASCERSLRRFKLDSLTFDSGVLCISENFRFKSPLTVIEVDIKCFSLKMSLIKSFLK